MHYQEQSECQADDDYFKDNLQNLLSETSFQGSVFYTGGCQSESVGDARAGSTCYEQVESSGRRLSEFYSNSFYWDSQYPGFAPPPSSTPNPVCGCEEMDVAFCNYDYGNSGFCESCGDVSTSPCDQRGLPDAGVADCEACCNVSHPYPHPRPNRIGS